MTTEKCKEFIDSISTIIASPANDKWKRIKKYKENNILVREFQNETKRTLFIGEYKETFFLLKMEGEFPNLTEVYQDYPGWKFIGNKIQTEEDTIQFLVDAIKADNSIIDAHVLKDALITYNWNCFQQYNVNEDDPMENVDEYDEENNTMFDLQYAFDDGNNKLNYSEIKTVYECFMPMHDTRYRYSVALTNEGYFCLSDNNPD